MQGATGLQFHYVIANGKLVENHTKRKYCKCNSFQVSSDLLNSENLIVAIAQLCNELEVCNCFML